MARRATIVTILMGVALAAVIGFGRTVAQDATEPGDRHPIVGSWMIAFPDNPDAPPSFYTFAADGTVVGTSSAGGRHGAWQVGADGQVVEFTVAGLASVGPSAAFIPIRILGEAVVAEDGNTLTITYVVEPLDPQVADGVAAGPFTATGTRIGVEQLELPGTPEATPEPGMDGEATPLV